LTSVTRIMRSLAKAVDGLELPAVEKISEAQAEDPFQILIATLLSARTQDATTHAASTRVVQAGADARRDGAAVRPEDRRADLPGQLLP
jgi:endonuclease III